ncbi:MAG: hypothetical protein M1816_000454 [Peltula sp. TS41687]|nr:MAG: hypothetical protein M1816_000454 [Peltula sp. TS41687]
MESGGATAELIIRLQLENIDSILQSIRTSDGQGDLPDSLLALSMYREELAIRATILSDRALASSLGGGAQDAGLDLAPKLGSGLDDDLISSLTGIASATTMTAAWDQLTEDMGGPSGIPHHVRSSHKTDVEHPLDSGDPEDGLYSAPSVGSQAGPASMIQALMSGPRTRGKGKVRVHHVSKLRNRSLSEPAFGPSWYDQEKGFFDSNQDSIKGKGKAVLRLREECVACKEECADYLKAPCSHQFCGRCTADWFTAASKDEALFPVRCCEAEITLSLARRILPEKLARQYELKAIELSSTNRTYCPDPSCSAFVPPDSIQRDIVTCNVCWGQTCVFCEGQPHDGVCSKDEKAEQILGGCD